MPLALLLALPLLVAMPLLLGWLQADPMLYRGELAQLERGPLRGVPYADPNNGYTTQALGYRAALEWLQGRVPWWNPYSGVGLPLAAEYQPAAFFPPTLLLLLPRGTVLLQLALQVIAGVGAYGLLRQLGLLRLAATTGALLFAFNGTLAWFAHGPATAVPFLPWMLWGLERARDAVIAGTPGGWRTFALAMGLGLLAGFPETAYINGLLALAWSIVRGMQLASTRRLGYALRVCRGGLVGLALAAPQVVSFVMYLPEAELGGHVGTFATAALPSISVLPSLVAPYVYGPIGGYIPTEAFHHVWGTAGGYVTILVVLCALYGAFVRRGAITWLLLAWVLLALGKTWAVQPALALMNLIPGVAEAAFMRYAQPSWSLALIVLSAFAIDDLARGTARRRALLVMAALALGLLVGAAAHVPSMWPELNRAGGLRNAALGSMAWAVITIAVVVAAAAWRMPGARAARALGALLVCEAALMYAIPTLSNPRRGVADMEAIAFLQRNLGLQRFFTLGPIQPNFGAYFGIASINHNYLPVSRRWIAWLRRHVDAGLADVAVFDGKRPGVADRLLRDLEPYRQLGVRYVVAPADSPSFADARELRLVHRSSILSIYELSGARAYFDVAQGDCQIAASHRLQVVATCSGPALLVRRELNFPGWRITVNGAKAPMLAHDDLFQAVELPKGKSEVWFAYAPPRIGWAWSAAAAGLLLLVWPRRR